MEWQVDIRKTWPGFSLQVQFSGTGDMTGVLGASGSGKSMTLRCIAGLERPDEGHIRLGDRVLFDSDKGINLSPRERNLGYLFQHAALFPNMTVSGNIGFALRQMTKTQRMKRVAEMLARVSLGDLAHRYPHQLSGGQRQRVALARALALSPEGLLLDEPFSALDESLRETMIAEMAGFLKTYEGAVLFVTHQFAEAWRLCGQLVLLTDGRVAGCGSKELLYRCPPSKEAAMLTGLRNISPLAPQATTDAGVALMAIDWGFLLRLPEGIHQQPRRNGLIRHVGIRATDIRLAHPNEHENAFYCNPLFHESLPGVVRVGLVPHSAAACAQGFSGLLLWEMPVSTWETIRIQRTPLRICLPREKLCLIGS